MPVPAVLALEPDGAAPIGTVWHPLCDACVTRAGAPTVCRRGAMRPFRDERLVGWRHAGSNHTAASNVANAIRDASDQDGLKDSWPAVRRRAPG